MKNKLTILLIAGTLLQACNKKLDTYKSGGTIVKESVDGCTWLIKLDNNSLLEPTNLAAFNVTIKDGQRVNLEYRNNTDKASICMMGQLADIISITNN